MAKRKKAANELVFGRDVTEQDLQFVERLKSRSSNESIVSIYRNIYKPDEPKKASHYNLAKQKMNTYAISTLMEDYQERMDAIADLSLDVAEDILRNGRSEKTKADLAIEFIRQRVGAPVQKNVNTNLNAKVIIRVAD